MSYNQCAYRTKRVNVQLHLMTTLFEEIRSLKLKWNKNCYRTAIASQVESNKQQTLRHMPWGQTSGLLNVQRYQHGYFAYYSEFSEDWPFVPVLQSISVSLLIDSIRF